MDFTPYQTLLTTDVSDAMPAGFAMSIAIRSLWQPAPALMGLAYTVKCCERSNTHLHNAIYQAPPHAIIVVETDGQDYAVAGGNVCAVAQQNKIAGFVIDGVIRDLAEVRDLQFPVYARGVFPKPGGKNAAGSSQQAITCGDVKVNTGDLLLADEEGIVVVPQAQIETVLEQALQKKAAAEQQTLAEWRSQHEAKIRAVLSGD